MFHEMIWCNTHKNIINYGTVQSSFARLEKIVGKGENAGEK